MVIKQEIFKKETQEKYTYFTGINYIAILFRNNMI